MGLITWHIQCYQDADRMFCTHIILKATQTAELISAVAEDAVYTNNSLTWLSTWWNIARIAGTRTRVHISRVGCPEICAISGRDSLLTCMYYTKTNVYSVEWVIKFVDQFNVILWSIFSNPQITGINIYTNCGKLLTHVCYLYEPTTIHNPTAAISVCRRQLSTVQLNVARKLAAVKFSCPPNPLLSKAGGISPILYGGAALASITCWERLFHCYTTRCEKKYFVMSMRRKKIWWSLHP